MFIVVLDFLQKSIIFLLYLWESEQTSVPRETIT